MNFTVKKIALCAIFFFIGNLTFLWPASEESKISSLQDYCFEILKSQANQNVSDSAGEKSLHEISRISFQLLTAQLFTKDGQISVIESLYPEKIALMDCSYNYSDCLPQKEVASPDWIETIVYALAREGSDYDYDLDYSIFENLNGRNDKGNESANSEGEIKEKNLSSSNGALRHYTFGSENLVQSKNGSSIILTDEAEGLVRRKTFTADYKILKYEEFSSGETAKELTCNLKRDYYHDDEGKLVQTVEEKLTENIKIIQDFNEKNQLVRKRISHTTDGKSYDDSDTSFEYDENGNETCIYGKNWYWEKDRSNRYHAKTATYKKVWNYSKFSETPDYEYYENDLIRMRSVYVSEKVYNETMYFDNDLSVETTYEDGIKTLERILLRGKEQRRTVFEKE